MIYKEKMVEYIEDLYDMIIDTKQDLRELREIEIFLKENSPNKNNRDFNHFEYMEEVCNNGD